MPPARGHGRRTVEQTRSVDIRDLRKAAYVGEAEGNWLDARIKLFTNLPLDSIDSMASKHRLDDIGRE